MLSTVLVVLLTLLFLLILRRLVCTTRLTGTRGSIARRFTAFVPRSESPMVLFLIGTRVNSWWTLLRNVGRVRVFGQLAGPNFEGTSKPDAEKHGCLYQREWGGLLDLLFGDGTLMVQYWRSMEDLLKYNQSQEHLASRKQYYAEMEALGVVSIWHETYLIQPGAYENVFGNSHLIGIAAVPGVSIVPVGSDSPLAYAAARMKASAN